MMLRTAPIILYIEIIICNETLVCHDLDSMYHENVTISGTGAGTMVLYFGGRVASPAIVTRT